eukprot:COSAG05_NODE_84_length_20716_cov_100.586312_3_plen_156_part_00
MAADVLLPKNSMATHRPVLAGRWDSFLQQDPAVALSCLPPDRDTCIIMWQKNCQNLQWGPLTSPFSHLSRNTRLPCSGGNVETEFAPGSSLASWRPSSDQRLQPAPLRVIFMPNSVDPERICTELQCITTTSDRQAMKTRGTLQVVHVPTFSVLE